MADIKPPTPEMELRYLDWCDTRPPAVAKVARRFRPWKLYRMRSTGHRVMVYSIAEPDCTLTVLVLGDFNAIAFERKVFGINPDDLVECDLPSPDEPLGVACQTEAEIEAELAKLSACADPHCACHP